MNKNAIISVYDKTDLKILCNYFKNNNINIISTGNTAKHIKKMGFKCQLVSSVTKFKEILEGRVKTLHPNIHASLLFDRYKKKHTNEFKKIKFPIIDFVIVNLYPFEKFIKKNSNYEKCIEMIDIGGTALLRSAAKNHKSITVISDPKDYKKLINNIKIDNKNKNLLFKKQMAKKAFLKTSKYDSAIYKWLGGSIDTETINIKNHKKVNLRYGENPHQKSFYLNKDINAGIYKNLIQGKNLSFNNIKDIESSLNCIRDFSKPTSVIIKHTSPCGVASNKNLYKAIFDSIKADSISAFGGIVAINRTLDQKSAKLLIKNFFEIILAPNFTKESLKILKTKKNLTLIKTNSIKDGLKNEIYSVHNGYLVQEKNKIIFNKSHLKLVSNYNSSKNIINDLIFAFKVCKHVKSNAIVLVKNQKTISIGAGQTSRIDSTKIAINKIKKQDIPFVAASDAFFPFTDNIKLLIKKRCKAIVQPSGSINDKKIIEFANKNKFPLYFSKFRFFKH